MLLSVEYMQSLCNGENMRISPINLNTNVAFKSKLPPVIEDKKSCVQDYWGEFAKACINDATSRENLNFCLKSLRDVNDKGILALDVLRQEGKSDEYSFSLYKNVNDIVLDKEDSTDKPNLKRRVGSIRLYKDDGVKSYVSVITDGKNSSNRVLKPQLADALLDVLRRITYYGSAEHKAIYGDVSRFVNAEQLLDEYR